jgi:hypothetical protein
MTSSLLKPLSDEQIKIAASSQVGRDIEVEAVHISLIRAADTVLHDGKVQTVGPKDIKHNHFMGSSLFGDSYILGLKPVQRLLMGRVLQPAHA